MSPHSTTLDRTGVFASVFCAVHCAVAPLLLLIAPTLGGIWADPLSHIAIAALVLPVAAMALRNGLRTHGRRWILALGGLGFALVVVGVVMPYMTAHGAAGCDGCDACCPSFVIDEVTGEERLHIPAASVVNLFGGISLVIAHIANLRCCATCR